MIKEYGDFLSRLFSREFYPRWKLKADYWNKDGDCVCDEVFRSEYGQDIETVPCRVFEDGWRFNEFLISLKDGTNLLFERDFEFSFKEIKKIYFMAQRGDSLEDITDEFDFFKVSDVLKVSSAFF